ncbi:MAG: SusC/RagA family TonB-linked outer membrane protein [Bacteroidales bacterium]|nr:SusC/RagA family TonB-linked outer membrane protein [Bacteroidales bacterium]
MKISKYKYLAAALCTANVAMAQEEATVAATPDSAKLNEQAKVMLAFREVAASDALVGVSTMNYRDVIEKDYLTYPLSDLLAFVPGGASTWGGSYLTLIDGVPRDLDNIKPDEIETVSFLKGANAVALYGSHAAKGVLLITTKRGAEGDIRIKARANTGWYVDKAYPKYLGSAEYMVLYNEARVNDGLNKVTDPYYSAEDIYHYASGENPYRYPSVDFYSKDYIKKSYNRTDATAEIDGGNDRARYYTNISFYNVGTRFKVGEAKKSYTNRFSVRGNVDLNVSDYIAARVDANITFYNERGYSGGNYWEAASTWRPNRIAPFIPLSYVNADAIEAQKQLGASSNIIDGKFLGGTTTDATNVFADMYCSGSSKKTTRQFQFETGLDVDLSPLTEGLSFHTQFGMDFKNAYTQSYSNTYRTYTPTWSNLNGKDEIIAVDGTATIDLHTGSQNIGNSSSQQTYSLDARFNYDRTFDEHSIGAIAVLRGFQYRKTGSYHSESDASVGFNVHYDFAKRYFIDVTGTVAHTAKLAEGHRNAFSPSVTLGWNIAKESFLEGSALNDLMFSVSASNVANDVDIDSYTKYLGSFSETGMWWSWTDQSQQSTVSKRGSNNDLDFIRNKEFSLGLRGGLLDNTYTFTVSAYLNKQTGKIISAEYQMPEYMRVQYGDPNKDEISSFITSINYEDDLRKGMEFSLGYNKKIGEVDFSAFATGRLYTTEATKRDDTRYKDAYQKREGKFIDGVWGYECLGFFKDQADIDKSADQSSFGQEIKPGDLKYKDQNGDGRIDNKDEVELGRESNPFEYGLGLTAKYSGFTLFVACDGAVGGTVVKKNKLYWMSGDDKYSVEARNRWTKENANSATLPRLTTTAAQNNRQTSDFWTYKTNIFDISKVQLTYDLPSSIFEGMKVLSAAQVYVSGSDLVRFSKEREYEETNVGSAPQTRFYNLGVKVTF